MASSISDTDYNVKKLLKIDTAITVGDIALILNKILFNICSDDKATIPKNVDLLEELENMEKAGSAKLITFFKNDEDNEGYYVSDKLAEFIKQHEN